MKVFCINDEGWSDYDHNDICKGNDAPGPKYGEVCTAISDFILNNEHYYKLLEYYHPEPTSGYLSSAFIPISEQEEEVSAESQILELTK